MVACGNALVASDSRTETGEKSQTTTARTARLAVDSRADCDGAQFLHSER
ncbi:hypothetical protein HSR122_2247 [Halapricum desulfuricans]|uniref:Uncharacterized protein n=1 Tax=Halapricum desulfuricans TaxID=2841257 RepID=A0A897NAA4_9EURY|nr:hypothetical protein HSR122_2247 [Halapricum desulfuricans]